VPTPKTKASLNASLYTAAGGEFAGNREESPFFVNAHHSLKNKEHEGNKRQEMASCVNRPNYRTGWRGIQHIFRNPLQDKELRKIQKTLAQNAAHFAKVPSKLL